MMDNKQQKRNYTIRQITVQRKNLVYACRLAVKSLIDQACFELIEEDNEALDNFFAVMEHILIHRLKPHQTWYGGEEQRWFWDYIRSGCKRVPHSSLASIENLEKPKTARGKGRAWLRMALMEKRLSEYLSSALQQTKLTKSFYQDGAVLLSEDASVLAGVLLGLNAIDFSFDIRAENLDIGMVPVIDFTPYLKFEQSPQSISSDQRELSELSKMAISLDSNDVFMEDESDTWQIRYEKVDGKLRMVVEQKGYLEELVRLRESQLEEVHRQRQKLIETIHHYESESRRERQQLEAVIIELQAQLTSMKEEHRVQTQRLETMLRRYSSQPPVVHIPDIPLSELHHASPRREASPEMLQVLVCSSVDLPVSTTAPAIVSAHTMQSDTRSIMSGTSSISVPLKDTDAQSNQSMVPLAGSFSSEISFRSGELPLHPLAPGRKSADQRSVNESVASGDTPEKLQTSTKARNKDAPFVNAPTTVKMEEDLPHVVSKPSEHKGTKLSENELKGEVLVQEPDIKLQAPSEGEREKIPHASGSTSGQTQELTASEPDCTGVGEKVKPALEQTLTVTDPSEDVKSHYSPDAGTLLQSAFDSNGGTSTDEGEGS